MEMKIHEHDKALEDHEKRLNMIEQNQAEFKVEIKNLCNNLKSLTNTMQWFIGIWVTSLLGFFFIYCKIL
jgi:hypothetical protein